jgi:pimeloyl-ACP methyl ester carboxylesterase
LIRSRRAASLLIPVVAVAGALAASPASASKIVAIDGAPAPGPKVYDRVQVDKYGPRKADTVLVLIPGTGGGTGSVAPVARDLAKRVDGLQVWGFERREQAFEDTSGFQSGDPAEAEDFYLSFQYDRVTAEEVPFVAEWGFATEMNDLREVVDAASRGGRHVILGGHSRGASSAVAYAAWDFGDEAGYEALDGLVLIDGGLGAFGPQDFTLAEAKERLAEIREGDVFSDPLGSGIPEIGPIFAQIAALYARVAPDAESALQDNPIVVGAGLSPPYPVTNEGFVGYLFDETYSPLSGALHIRAGDFGPGSPRPWQSGENTPIEAFAKAFARYEGNATEWYYPNRMILDTAAANALGRTPAGRYLGLRLFHTKRIDVPLYAFQTELTDGGVLRGARTLIRKSNISKSKLVDASEGTSHLDPVLAPAVTNRFTQTARPFLKRIVRRNSR